MTINSTIRKAGPFIGNGTASSFPFTYKVFQASDLDVVRLDQSTNVQTTLQLTTDYTVVLNQDQDSNPGGTVTLVAGALATGYTLTMTSDVPNLQPTDLTNQGGFYPEVINDALDRATIQIQQLQEQTDRSLKVALSSDVDGTLPPPSPNDLIGWNADANALVNVDPGTIATVVAYSTAYADVFTCNGVATTFALTRNPGVIYNMDVSINGIVQVPNTNYTLSGSSITMTSAPPVNSVLLVKYREALPIADGDSQDIRYIQSGTGAVQSNVQKAIRRVVSVSDFGASYLETAANNSTYITAAALYAASIDAELEFEPGTYNHNGITLSGAGFSWRGKNTRLNYTGSSSLDAVYITAESSLSSGLSIKGIEFNGGFAALKIKGEGSRIYREIFIRECAFKNTASGALWMEHCEDVFIDNNLFQNCGDNGVYYSFSRKAVISNNIVRNCMGSGGIVVGYCDLIIPKAEKIAIIGNVIENDENAISANYNCGIDAVFCSDVLISGNLISNTPNGVGGKIIKSGILVEEHVIEDVQIFNNQITNIPEDGMRIGFASSTRIQNITITGNKMSDIGKSGIYLAMSDEVTINGNTFENIGKDGVLIDSDATGTTIANNVFINVALQNIYGAYMGVRSAGARTNIIGNSFVDGQIGGVLNNSTGASATYSVDSNGLISFYSSGVLSHTVDPTGKTWGQLKTAIDATPYWVLDLYAGCDNLPVTIVRRTGYRWDANVQQYNVGTHFGMPEPYYYIYLDTSAVDCQVLKNTFKTNSLGLPNHHGNGNLFKFNSDTVRDNGAAGGCRQLAGTAAPSSGYFIRGDIVWNESAASAGFAGWICVSGGNPGTWKTFGVIS